MAQTPNTLLFDLGGVVIDIDFDRVFSVWAGHAGCDPQAIRDRFAMDRLYRDHETGRISGTEFFAGLRRGLQIDLTDDQFVDGWNRLFVGEMPGIDQELTRAAAHFPLYAFSNTNEIHKAYLFDRYAGVLGHFKTVFTSSALGVRKPDRDAFALVAERIGTPLDRILLFDDTGENIDGAAACGMQTILVTGINDVINGLNRLIEG